jgi:hypothetical protein
LLAEGFIKLRDKLLVLSGVGDKDVDHAPILGRSFSLCLG